MKRETIVICDHCEGCGKMAHNERISVNETQLVITICPKCKGSGRMKITTITEPYKPEEGK